jgi:hypothetical protein
VGVTVSLKYAHVERERRWLLATLPELRGIPTEITDRYLVGTRLRLRQVVRDRSVSWKLGHKVRLDADASEIACTNFYLDEAEWTALAGLPAQVLHKKRWRVELDRDHVAVDVFGGHLSGLVLAEIDRGSGLDRGLPPSFRLFDVAGEVTSDEAFTGAVLASSTRDGLREAVARYGVDLPG